MLKMFRTQRNAARMTLAQANAARDRRAWPVAAALYDLYLSGSPGSRRADIWVQLGHARKETEDRAGAVAAYLRSIELAPDVADTHLHLGHLHKRMSAVDAAVASLAEAERLEPGIGDAATEIQALVKVGSETTMEKDFEDPDPLRFADPPPLTPEQVAFVPNFPPIYLGLSRRFCMPSTSS